jgi:hypothetical protein
MLPRGSEDIERSEASCHASRLHLEFHADTPNEFRLAALRGKHAGQKKQIARLNCFHISAERLGWHGELDAEFFQPLLGAFRPRMFVRHKAVAFDLVLIFSPLEMASDMTSQLAETLVDTLL